MIKIKQVLVYSIFISLILFFGCDFSSEKDISIPFDLPDQVDNSDNNSDDDSSVDDDDHYDDDDIVADDDDDIVADDDDSDPLDPNADEDRDGMTNGQELTDKTDPYDPSDALAWHPEINSYPRLFADASRWNIVKQAIQNQDPDYTRLFSRILNYANMVPGSQTPGTYSFSILTTNSQIANAAALAAFVNDDPDLADKAFSIIESTEVIFAEVPLTDYDHGTILGGHALVEFCHAYDLLAGFDLVQVDKLNIMRSSILDIADKLFNFYIQFPLGKLLQNNHIIKLASGFGMVGITFNDIPRSAVYMNIALSTAPYVLLDFQMPQGGGQGEGPNYLDYTFKTYLPFVAAYHRFAQGESFPYKIECRARLWPHCVTEIIEVEDPWSDGRMEDLLNWRLAVNMPNGKCPPIDDSNLSCGYSGPIAALFSRSDYAWHYRESQSCSLNTSAGAAQLEMAYLDSMPDPLLPTFGPSIMMAQAGQAMLREDWSADSMYALLNGEHGKARLAGIGHEQADATSFIFYALGQMMAIDSGYISYDDRWNVIHARNHNLILVDDKGPPLGLYFIFADSDGYLSEFVDRPPFRSVKVEADYREANIQRRVMLIDDDYFVTYEKVASDHPRDYAWLLQANAGGSTDGNFILEQDGASIQRPNGVMRTYLQSDGPITFIEDEEKHGFAHSGIEYHSVLRGEITGGAVRFLGVHPVADLMENLPNVTNYPQLQELVYVIEGEDYRDIIIVANDGGFVVGPLPEYEGRIESDGHFAWVRFDPSTETVIGEQIGGTYLTFNQNPL